MYDNYDDLYKEKKEINVDESDELTHEMPTYESYEYEDEEQLNDVIDEELYKR